MADLALTLACGPYDRMEALRYGAVRPRGVALDYVAISPPHEIFARMVGGQEFDASEMSAALYLIRRGGGGGGDFPFVALPVFPSRVFRHGNVFVNRKAGIASPEDLAGRRVGLQEYRQTAAVWIRGILRDEYGLDTASVVWVEGGTNAPRRPNPDVDIAPAVAVRIERLAAGDTTSRALAEGRIDAMLGAQIPESFRAGAEVARLFPDYRAAERAYFEKTGIFPIMHTLVIREALTRAHPWLAQSLFDACEAAKAHAVRERRFSGALRTMTPWLHHDIEEMDALFAGDGWPYGLEANRTQLETLMRYLVEDGLLGAAVAVEELFAPVA